MIPSLRARLRILSLALGGLLVLLAVARAQAPAVVLPAPGQCYALLIGGIGGQDPYTKWYADWLTRFHTYLAQAARVPEANIIQLSGKDATFDAITAVFGKLAQRIQPQDQFVLFIVGHGEITGPLPTLELAGPDPTAPQLAALLNAIPAKNQVVLNFSASSGDFLRYLSAPGRVNITATSPTEVNEPVFAEFFLRGLESKRADTARNGAITLLEAFNWAAQSTTEWIARWQKTDSGGDPTAAIDQPTLWKASGRETVEIFEKLYGNDGMRRADPASDRNAADAQVALEPPDGQVTDEWAGRRVVDEHALLEDCGQGIGVSEIGDKGLQPILGQKPGDPGYLAGTTVLGQAVPHS
jgi:hypothetical protein